MTEREAALEHWYNAGNTDEFQEFFEVLVRELELFRHIHPGHVFRPNQQRFWELVAQKKGNMEPETQTWAQIVPGTPGSPTANIKQSSDVAGEIRLDEDETRQLIGWPPPP